MIRTMFILTALITFSFSQTGKTAAEQGITYEQFQAMHKTEKRSVERFKEAIKPIEKDLVEFWKGILEEKYNARAFVSVNSKGQLQYYTDNSPNALVDSVQINKCNVILKSISMPSIYDTSMQTVYTLKYSQLHFDADSIPVYYETGRSRENIMNVVL